MAYVERDNEIVYRAPYLQKDAFLSSFVVSSPAASQQAILDRDLNSRTGGLPWKYTALFNHAALVFADIGQVRSLAPEDANKGWIAESDVCWWILAAAYKPGSILPDHFAWYIPYIWVNTAYTMVNGRESFGFPKSFNTPRIPKNSKDLDGPFYSDAMVLPTYTPETPVQSKRILDVSRIGAEPPPKIDGSPFEHIIRKIVGEAIQDAELAAKVITQLLQPSMPVVYLKQFRDVVNPNDACYQAIIESNTTIRSIQEFGLMPKYQIETHSMASVDVAKHLGFAGTSVPSEIGMWCHLDFEVDLGKVVWSQSERKTKVAVVGGGVSALSAVFALTSTPELRAKYDVTVHQFGHRLGGKGASGRNIEEGDRIEEHGLHIWFGFYENAFKWMRAAYQEMGRTTGPIQTWKQAFHNHSYVVLMEAMQQGFVPWTFDFPTNSDTPGDGGVLPSPIAYIEMIIELLIKWLEGEFDQRAPDESYDATLPDHVKAVHAAALGRGPANRPPRDDSHGTIIPPGPIPPALHPIGDLLKKAYEIVRSLDNDPKQHDAQSHSAITWLIQKAMEIAWLFLRGSVDTDLRTRQVWVALNLGGSTVCGMIDDHLLFNGFDSLDKWDFKEWLSNNGANDTTIEKSGTIRGLYDLAFCFVHGDTNQPNFGAGTALRGTLRMLFTYKGSLMWRMEAGMGDIVATPFYECLKRRGVKFEFFHRVTNMEVEGKNVSRIHITKQVQLKDEAAGYQPLYPVKDLPCWPSEPLYDQIVGGDEIKNNELINFESAWSAPWKGSTEIVLELGKDFDQVILAASIGALPYIAKPLLDANPKLKASCDHVLTCQTQALQLWNTRTTTDLGWVRPSWIEEDPVLGAFQEPIDTWADMSDLIPRENWQPPNVKSIAYFCGPWIDANPIPPFSDHEFPNRELARYQLVVDDFKQNWLPKLWPNYSPGDERSIYTRVNLDPTERYVLSVKGSVQYRLHANQSGFDNVVLCGDWTYNGINAGCVEAAVTGGLWASNALCGVPAKDQIYGENP
ncbi:MAG: NAD(P)-binding protein [Polyangiales bacterium]